MRVLGLTGSIGMGKSTTAGLFAHHGVPVFDADAAVHALYAGEAVEPIGASFPGSVVDGRVDRALLSARILEREDALARLEAIVHPLVRKAQARFVGSARTKGARTCLLDIPLLFETGRESEFDAVLVASAPQEVQRARVLARPGMTEEKLDAILARQMPDAEKRRRAHAVIRTDSGIESAGRQVEALMRAFAGTA